MSIQPGLDSLSPCHHFTQKIDDSIGRVMDKRMQIEQLHATQREVDAKLAEVKAKHTEAQVFLTNFFQR